MPDKMSMSEITKELHRLERELLALKRAKADQAKINKVADERRKIALMLGG